MLTCVNGSGAEESSQHTAKLKLFIFCYTYKVGFVPPLCLGCKLKMRCVPWQRYDVYEYLCYFINIILPACATVKTPLLYGSPCIFHSTQWHIIIIIIPMGHYYQFSGNSLCFLNFFMQTQKLCCCCVEFQSSAYLLCFVSVCPWSVLSSASLLSLDPEVSVESSRDSLLVNHILLCWIYSWQSFALHLAGILNTKTEILLIMCTCKLSTYKQLIDCVKLEMQN